MNATRNLNIRAHDMTETVYVVRDASGEYVTHEDGSGRSPASNEAHEFETRAAAENACVRTTDEVYMRGKDDDE